MTAAALPGTPLRTRIRRLASNKRVKLWMAWTLALTGAVLGVVTFAVLTPSADSDPDLILSLLYADLIVLILLTLILARRVVLLWVRRRRAQPGARLHVQLVAAFSLLAATPAIIVAAGAAGFFTIGIQGWFSERVSSALTHSLAVADAYYEDHRKLVLADVLWIANGLARAPSESRLETATLDRLVTERGIAEALVLRSDGQILARSSLSLLLAFDQLPAGALQRALQGETVVFQIRGGDRVRALAPLTGLADQLLYVGRYIDTNVLRNIDAVRTAVGEYQLAERERASLHITFTMVFIAVAVLLVAVAAWIGFQVANRFAGPISELVHAANRVRDGDLSARVREAGQSGELMLLLRAFNRMTGQIEDQRYELVAANRELDTRRRFTEAVLAGVSAGVVAVDSRGVIFLSNHSASNLLGEPEDSLTGQPFADAIPAMSDLFHKAVIHPTRVNQDQVVVVRNGQERILLARVNAATRDTRVQGYVITFDDMTERILAQRAAAWRGVARRIAHEVRNPLTPIRLAAERLKRRYAGEVQTDPAVFESCIDTIVRQVVEMTRMVDEFSEFARMPPPALRRVDMVALINGVQAINDTAHADIQVSARVPDLPVYVLCDPSQMDRALGNLVQNAVQAIQGRRGSGPTTGNIEIILEATADGDTYRVAVEDDGGGFPDDFLDRATEPYVTTRRGGTGLGLAIVRRIVEDQGGRVSLANTDRGARVVLTLPCAPSTPTSPAVAA